MKRVAYVITPDSGSFGPGQTALYERGVVYEAILDVELLADGSVVFQVAVDGETTVIEEVLSEEWDEIQSYEIFDRPSETVLQIQFEPEGALRDLLQLHREYGVLLEYPQEFVDPERSSIRIVEAGPESELRSLIQAKREQVDVTITNVTTYEPATDRLFAELTERQREVLVTAVGLGYYDTPRGATHDDIARNVDASSSAVGQVLRRIESTVFTSIVPSSIYPEDSVLDD